MKRRSSVLCAGAFVAGFDLGSSQATAAAPTTSDCLGASEASFESGHAHELRRERTQLLVCAAPSCPADIRKECIRRVEEVNAAIPTIIFDAKDGLGADVIAVRVTMDREVLTERLDGTALSIDPGEHTFTFETAGQPSVTKTVLIQEAQKGRRESVAFGVRPPAADMTHGMAGQRILAVVAGGAGVVGIGFGTAFGLMAASKKSAAESACPRNPCPTGDGVAKWSDAGAAGDISTIGFIVGAAGVVGAALLWFTAPGSSARASAQVAIGPGALEVKGTW